VSVERIARSFLSEFSRTISVAPAADGGAGGGRWASQLPPEEKKRLRAERRAKLGADLLSVSGDVPFAFPPTFTFVFRAFTSLDGIGKGLDPGYDLTRLAQPYLRELLDLRDGSATLSAVKSFGKAVGWRPQDIQQVVTSPRR
jgi:predicted unusual protein kinase regulating ubiquinone biosynthesis (AarF/ABC1/UbiB family)